MIPPFDPDTGAPPLGDHQATLDEISQLWCANIPSAPQGASFQQKRSTPAGNFRHSSFDVKGGLKIPIRGEGVNR